MRGKILKREKNIITVELYDDISKQDEERYEINGDLYLTMDLFDPQSITQKQRDHIYALIGDMSFHTGFPEEAWERYLKVGFMHFDNMVSLPSFKANNMSKSRASKFIEFTIITCIKLEIPFREGQYYLTRESANVVYYLVMNRLCVVCGKPHAQLHHSSNLIGMGRDRNKHNHLLSGFLTLCTDHHDEVHKKGLERFNKEHILKPIKLNKRELKQLNIRGKYD